MIIRFSISPATKSASNYDELRNSKYLILPVGEHQGTTKA